MTTGTKRRPPTTAVPINGAALRELRIRTGVSVEDLAREINVGRPYITKIELGYSPRVSAKVFNALLSALRITDRRALLGPDAA